MMIISRNPVNIVKNIVRFRIREPTVTQINRISDIIITFYRKII